MWIVIAVNLKAYEEKENNSFAKIIYRPLLIKKMILFFETAIASTSFYYLCKYDKVCKTV